MGDLIFNEKTFSRSKEDFVWFIKTAIADKTSDAYAELFHRMLKIFVGADTNKDGLVTKASFFKLIEGYIPEGCSIYSNATEKEEALENMFNQMDLKYTGVITFDEWLKFCLEHIGAKIATLEAHPIIDHGTKGEFKAFVSKAVVPGCAEHTELFWYLLEIFIAHDTNKDGNVTEYARNDGRQGSDAPHEIGVGQDRRGVLWRESCQERRDQEGAIPEAQHERRRKDVLR